MKTRLTALIFTIFISISAFSQTNSVYQSYIDQYKEMAVEQMERYRIPASITLAQGLLESGAGKSILATKANNHFGIKVGSTWNGPYITKDDDKKGEHFRKYNNAVESFDDHSAFLHRSRYASLFDLEPTDYKGWAYGLKKCGYATSPVYAEQLIKIIEDYKLYQYDTMHMSDFAPAEATQIVEETPQQVVQEVVEKPRVAQPVQVQSQDFYTRHPVQSTNGNYYIKVLQGDRLDEIAAQSGVSKRKLLKYNELPYDYEVGAGDIIYFAKKKATAEECKPGQIHTVKAGESLYDISQIYGVRVSTLYRLNGFSDDYQARPGDKVRLR